MRGVACERTLRHVMPSSAAMSENNAEGGISKWRENACWAMMAQRAKIIFGMLLFSSYHNRALPCSKADDNKYDCRPALPKATWRAVGALAAAAGVWRQLARR